MARAYKKTYLNGAMRNLAVMLDCGVRKYGYPIEEFYEKFLASDVSRQFAGGNPRYLVGMSGAELADSVVESTGGTVMQENDGTYTVGPEYWAGWVLAYYQWLTRRSFAYMRKKGLGQFSQLQRTLAKLLLFQITIKEQADMFLPTMQHVRFGLALVQLSLYQMVL